MSLVESTPGAAPAVTADMAAVRTRRNFGRAVNQLGQACRMIKRLSDDTGKAELISALGDDGADLESTYAAFKTFAETHGITGLEDL